MCKVGSINIFQKMWDADKALQFNMKKREAVPSEVRKETGTWLHKNTMDIFMDQNTESGLRLLEVECTEWNKYWKLHAAVTKT